MLVNILVDVLILFELWFIVIVVKKGKERLVSTYLSTAILERVGAVVRARYCHTVSHIYTQLCKTQTHDSNANTIKQHNDLTQETYNLNKLSVGEGILASLKEGRAG